MAVSDDRLDRDPQIASLLASVANETPPAALDAAIRAAARREVSARPVSAAGESSLPVSRARRNWYVPVSVAAVVVLSVSLVTLMQEEKGGELMHPPRASSSPSQIPAVPSVVAPPAPAAKADTPPQHAVPGRPPRTQDKPTATADASSEPAVASVRSKQRRDQAPPSPDNAAAVGSLRKEPSGESRLRQQSPSAEAGTASTAPSGESNVANSPSPAPLRERQKRADPFPAASGREAPAMSPPSAPPPAVAAAPASPPIQANREAMETRARNEADYSASRSMAQQAPRASAAAPKPSTMADALPQAAPPLSDSRASAPVAKPMTRVEEKPTPVWFGLEHQSAEKWLERIEEFKRAGRFADANALLDEFRKRFPDHPASAR